MLKNKLKLLPIILIISLLLTSCQQKIYCIESQNFLMDTLMKIQIFTPNSKFSLSPYFDILEDLDKRYDRHWDNSFLYKLNHGTYNGSFTKDDLKILNKASYYYDKTEGLFDISIAPLLDLWDINSDSPKVPIQKEIDNLLPNVGFSKINFDSEILSIPPNIEIDFGAILKGFATDKLKEKLDKDNISSALIDLGGNIYAHGYKPDGTEWKIGIRNPEENANDYVGILSVHDKAVVTSGIYERYFIENNNIFHHILNPKNGYPVENNLLSVTIVSENGLDADILSTACFLMGLEKGLSFVNKLENVDAIFITKKRQLYLSSNLYDYWQQTDSNFVAIY